MKLYEYFIENGNIYVVTEVCDGGEMFDRIEKRKGVTEKEAAIMFRQILLALTYLHNQGIAHRDIKPENFLFDKKDEDCLDIKMIDFGLSKVLNN